MVGWGLLGFGMIFFWVFFMQSEIIFWGQTHEWTPITGTVSGISSTNASQNNSLIYQIEFTYEVAERSYTQLGYTSGSWLTEGQELPVEYDAGSPEVARSPELRREMFSAGAALVVIVPLIAIAFLLFGFRKNGLDLQLLQAGHFAQGTLINKRATSTQINHQTVYEMTFEFVANNGRTYQVSSKTHQPELLEDESVENVLYLSHQPEKATLFDTISVAPELNPDGSLAPIPLFKSWVLIFPLLTLLGHGLYAMFRYGLW